MSLYSGPFSNTPIKRAAGQTQTDISSKVAMHMLEGLYDLHTSCAAAAAPAVEGLHCSLC